MLFRSRLEAPVSFSFATENVEAIKQMLRLDDLEWSITDIRVSGTKIDSRAIAKIEQVPLLRLASRVGIGENELTEQDVKNMGEVERRLCKEELEPPRVLALCEKMIAWIDEALRGIPAIVQSDQTVLEDCLKIGRAHV